MGNVNISSDELDVEAQKAAFNSLSGKKMESTHRREKQSSKTKTHWPSTERMSHVIQPAESHPVAQIAKDSYLGAALKNVGSNKEKRQHRQLYLQPSDPSSSSSNLKTSSRKTSSDANDWSLSQTRDVHHHRYHDNKHGRNKPHWRVSSRSSNLSRSTIKPIPPLEYDGRADACESEAYIRGGLYIPPLIPIRIQWN